MHLKIDNSISDWFRYNIKNQRTFLETVLFPWCLGFSSLLLFWFPHLPVILFLPLRLRWYYKPLWANEWALWSFQYAWILFQCLGCLFQLYPIFKGEVILRLINLPFKVLIIRFASLIKKLVLLIAIIQPISLCFLYQTYIYLFVSKVNRLEIWFLLLAFRCYWWDLLSNYSKLR